MTIAHAVSRAMLVTALGAGVSCATDHAIVATVDSGGTGGVDGGGEAVTARAGQSVVSELAGGGGTAAALPPPSVEHGGVAGTGGAPSLSSSAGTGAGAAGGVEIGGTGGNSLGGADAIGLAGFGALDPAAFEGLLCSCIGEAARFCGVDGVTYSCAGGCPAVDKACLHDCPCEETEPAPPDPAFWFPAPVASRRCGEGFVCLGDPSTPSFD